MPPKTLTKTLTKKSARPSTAGTRRTTVARKKQAAAPAPADIPRLVVGYDGNILFASTSMAKLLGHKDSALIQKPLRDIVDFVSPEDALRDRPSFGFGAREAKEDSKDAWTSSIMSGDHDVVPLGSRKTKPFALRFDHISLPDGRNYLIASSPADNGNDLSDVMDALAAKNKPAAAEPQHPAPQAAPADMWDAFLPAFVEMGNDFILLLSPRGKIEHANEIFYASLEGREDMYKGKPFLDLIHPEDRPYVQPVFKNLIQEGAAAPVEIIAFECRVVGQNKKLHWLDCRLKSHQGKLMLVGRDLTDIKKNELALLRREQQLSEAQSIGHMGHWTWRIGDECLEFSQEIYRIFGVTPEEFIPTIDSVNAAMHRRDRGRMAQAFQRAMIDRKNYVMEFRVVHPKGDVRHIELQGRCEMDDEGDVVALFGIMQDVTERTEHERELRHAVEEAERAYAAKSQFLANMSHELRTPLNAIIGFSEMIGRQMLGPIGTEKYLEYIGGIRESGEHLLDLITDILDMSKIEAGKYTLDVEEFNLHKVIRLAIHMIEGRALDAQVKVTCTIPDGAEQYIIGDRRAIMQMVLNLLSNAVKFTKPGGGVSVSCTNSDGMISICVEDTGIGIPASKLRYVTKPFEQAANQFTRNHEGSGLGLAITKELAELHGGTLTITSTVDVGTQVTITLPVKANDGPTSKA